MNQGMMMNTIVAAVVGGAIGACVVFFAAPKAAENPTPNLEGLTLETLTLKNLQVASVTITNQAALLNAEGGAGVVIKDGCVLAEKVVLGNKLIGKQVQGHAMVANRMFTTPDDLIQVPMDRWKFYTEIGSSQDSGGEVLVRSLTGPGLVNQVTTGGALFRMGFTPESGPQMLAFRNQDRSPMNVSWDWSELQKQQLSSNANQTMGANQSFDSPDLNRSIQQATPDPNIMR